MNRLDATVVRNIPQEPLLQFRYDHVGRLAGEAGEIGVEHLHLDNGGDALDVAAGLEEAADEQRAEVLVPGVDEGKKAFLCMSIYVRRGRPARPARESVARLCQ